MTKIKLCYICDYRRIISQYLTDINYDINTYNIESLSEYELSMSDNIQKLVWFIIKLPVTPIINIGKNLITRIDDKGRINRYTTLTIYEARNYINNLFDKKGYLDDVSSALIRILYDNFPHVLLKGILRTKQVAGKKSIKFNDVYEYLAKDTVSSVFYYDDIQSIEQFLCSNKTNGISLPSSCIRLSIRVWMSYGDIVKLQNYLNSDSFIYYKPLEVSNKLIYEKIPDMYDEDKEKFVEMLNIQSELYRKYNINEILSINNVYECVLTMTIKEWSSLITYMMDIEENDSYPIFTSIPFFLKMHRLSYSLFEIDKHRMSAILKKSKGQH